MGKQNKTDKVIARKKAPVDTTPASEHSAEEEEDFEVEASDDGSVGRAPVSFETLNDDQVEALQEHLRTATNALGRLSHKQKEYCTTQFIEKLELERLQNIKKANVSALSMDDGADDDQVQDNENLIPEKRRSPRKKAQKSQKSKNKKIKHSPMAAKANGLAQSSDSDSEVEEVKPSPISPKLLKKVLAALQSTGSFIDKASPAVPVTAGRASSSNVTQLGKYVKIIYLFGFLNYFVLQACPSERGRSLACRRSSVPVSGHRRQDDPLHGNQLEPYRRHGDGVKDAHQSSKKLPQTLLARDDREGFSPQFCLPFYIFVQTIAPADKWCQRITAEHTDVQQARHGRARSRMPGQDQVGSHRQGGYARLPQG